MSVSAKQLSVAIIFPFVTGLLLSSRVIPLDIFVRESGNIFSSSDNSSTKNGNHSGSNFLEQQHTDRQLKRNTKLHRLYRVNELGGDPFEHHVSLSIHRNGDTKACSTIQPSGSILQAFYQNMESSMSVLRDKYKFDAFLTQTLARSLLENKDTCHPSAEGSTTSWFGSSSSREAFLEFCDPGEDKTPVLLDHNKLIRVSGTLNPTEKQLPCHFHTREGVRILSFEQLLELARDKRSKEESCTNIDNDSKTATCSHDTDGNDSNTPTPSLEIYAVPAGRVFMFAPKFVGEIFELPHVSAKGLPVSLEVLSLSPRVFDVINFFSRTESNNIVRKARNEKSETHRIKRSSTGASGYNLNSKRTSENGFDTHGKDAMTVKKRCFQVLGFDEYIEGMADGLQVLRYNKTTAYIPHLDWIDDYGKNEEHNYDSEGVGSNRFATILLYMSDLPEDAGGETVFAKGWPADQSETDHVPLKAALEIARKSGAVADLRKGSWEEEMVAQCRSRLAVHPNSAKAVLFYSQLPNGAPDPASLHGGCPVLDGEKWAANLWVWNAIRGGYIGSPVNQDVVDRNLKKSGGKAPSPPGQLQATFTNTGTDPKFKKADLYFQETFWGPFNHGDVPLSVNTYEGHEWNVMVNGQIAAQLIIGKKNEQFKI